MENAGNTSLFQNDNFILAEYLRFIGLYFILFFYTDSDDNIITTFWKIKLYKFIIHF